MNLARTNLIMEISPYNGGGSATNTPGGMAAPVGTGKFNSWPFIPNAQLMMQKQLEAQRRRDRLRELAIGWFMNGVMTMGNTNGATTGAAPGSIF